MSKNYKTNKSIKNKENTLNTSHKIKNCRVKCMCKKCKYNIKEICLKGFLWITKDKICKSFKKK